MPKPRKFSLSKRLRSFSYAFTGLKVLFIEDHNARIHVLAAVCAIAGGILLKITLLEWVIITFAIGLVLIVETINSSLENIADFLTTENNDKIKKIKDLAAASVLISSIVALVIGMLIFLPKIITLLTN